MSFDDMRNTLPSLTTRIIHDITIHGSFYAEPINEALIFWLRPLDPNLALCYAPPGSVVQTLLHGPDGHLRDANRINVFLLRTEDFRATLQQDGSSTTSWERVAPALISFQEFTQSTCVVAVCPSNGPSVASLERGLLGRESMVFLDLSESAALYDIRSPENAQHLPEGMPYSREMYVVLGSALARALSSLLIPRPKLIVVDCDDTLWQGSCAEPDPVAVDAAHLTLQHLLIQRRGEGTLLAVVSKNDIEDVVSTFRSIQMPLKEEHITAWKVNWLPKSANIRELCRDLNLDAETILFIDNDDFECEEVARNCPETSVLHLPSHCGSRQALLARYWWLDGGAITEEDRNRSDWYLANQIRRQTWSSTVNLSNFLCDVHLNIKARPHVPTELERVAQLTQRTNQFNSTGSRYSFEQIKSSIENNGWMCWTASMTDDFGSFGVVSAVLCDVSGTSLIIHSFSLSCRALGRYVEDTVLHSLAVWAAETGLRTIIVEASSTGRNRRFFNFCWRLQSAGLAFTVKVGFSMNVQTILTGSEVHPFGVVLTPYRSNDGYEGVRVEKSEKNTPPLSDTRLRDYNALISRMSTVDDILSALQASRVQVLDRMGDPRQRLAAIWQKALSLPTVERDVDFFALGGDSLAALEMIYEINDSFGTQIPLTVLFESELTLVQLESRLEVLGAQKEE